MTTEALAQEAARLKESLAALTTQVDALAVKIAESAGHAASHAAGSPFIITGLTVFVLSLFIGYYVIWKVTPALHSPLMAVTNGISSVIIVGALIAVGAKGTTGFSTFMAFLATVLASVNIFGGFAVTHRMLAMFRKKDSKPAASKAAH